SPYSSDRLPTAVRPQKYDLHILTNLEGPEDQKFSGTVKITIEVLQTTDNITLHSHGLSIDRANVTLRQLSGDLQPNFVDEEPQFDYLMFITTNINGFQAGTIYELSVPFSGSLKSTLNGYYISSYKDSVANKTRWISATQFEPHYARRAFPCFDEPAYKATFAITLGHHKNYTALSNMPLKETKPHESLPDYVWSEFRETVPMSTYLVAYSINDFSYKPSTVENGVRFRTWARPDAIDQCDFAAEFGPQVLRHFEEFFGIKYPLPKLDQIAIPDFASGAMENWGLVTYRETALLYSKNHTSLAAAESVASTIAHELAHQWFGNLVTMEWWTDLWLNEGFATYIAKLGVDKIYPAWKTMDERSLVDLQTTFQLDSLEHSHPVWRPIRQVADIDASFDAISYKKGSAIIRMMHLFLGETSFRAGLKSYLELYAYKNAKQDDLWESLSKAAHHIGSLPSNYEVKEIMDSWTLQTGYPVINVSRNYPDKTAEIIQERFLRNTQYPETLRKKCWWVPLSYTSQQEQDFNSTAPKTWLECTKSGESVPKTIDKLPGSDQWVIFNIQISAPYKINYDATNWKLLINTLNSKDFGRIHILNRAQLIDDVMSLAWSGYQNYETALQLINYLKFETALLPWKTAFAKLANLRAIIRYTPATGDFKRFIGNLITPIYKHLNGINDTFDSISRDQILLKSMVGGWACRNELLDCVPQAQAYFRSWRAVTDPDKQNPIPLNIRGVAYCVSIRHGNKEDWEFLWQRYRMSNVGAERATMMSSLACSRDSDILGRYIHRAFNQDAIRKQDIRQVFSAVGSSKVGYPITKAYFM
ncbi:hypothetical protein KR018_009700, partial [Drosophila ironensis]